MATITNIALNSRSLNGCILISDGNGTTIENGNITTGDINSSSLTTNNINTSLLTISGEVRCNLNGPLSIPISISSLTGLLISYGNVSNSGATDFTNFGSTYTSTQQGFRFWNKSNTQTLTNLAIIDNTQTYFSSQLVGCTAETPLSSTSVVNRSYVDNNFVDLVSSESIGGVKNFTNNAQFRGTLTYYDTQTPFSNNSQFFHIGVTSVIKNNANSGIITYNTRTSAGVASNVMEISSSFLRMFKPIRIIDTNAPLTGYTEILQAGTLLSFTPSYNLGEYQFKTRTSTGTTNIPLIIDNDGISVFGTTSCAVMESSAYRGTSASADIAIGGTTTSGTILIGTVINGTLGGEIRIGTTLSTNNINGTTTFSSTPLCSINATTGSQLVNYSTLTSQGYTTLALVQANNNVWTGTNTFNTNLPTSTLTPTTANQFTTKAYVDGMPVHQILNTNNIWTGTNTFNTYLPTSTLTPSGSTELITKAFVDNNFVDKTTNQSINGLKLFLNKLEVFNTASNAALTLRVSSGTSQQSTISQNGSILQFLNNSTTPSLTYLLSGVTRLTISPTQMLLDSALSLVSNNLTAPTSTSTNNIYTNLGATGIINIGNSLSTNTIAGNTTFSSDITTQNIFCETALYLSDFIPPSSSYSSILVQNAEILNFDSNFTNNKFQFKVSTNPVLLIDGTNTTFSNNLVSNAQATFNNNAPISNVASTLNEHLTRKDYVDGNFMYKTNNVTESISGWKTFLNRVNLNGGTALVVETGTSSFGGTSTFNNTATFNSSLIANNTATFNSSLIANNTATFNNSLIANNTATFATDVLFSADTININGTTSAQDLDFFTSITLGTIHLFSSLSNSLVSMFNYSTNDVTLEINAKVKFRQVKLYNQVKTITANITLDFPLEETIVIRPTGVMFIELPLITANSLGMSFNFITNSTAYAIWFSTQGTDNIIKNGYTTGNTSTIVLGSIGVTSVQMTCLELTAGVYTWSFFSSLPERVSNPPGTIITMSVQNTPNGYLACNGGSYTASGIYANLYAVIGTTYGTNGVGTFKVPNFNNGSFLRGVAGNAAAIGTQQQDNIKTHTHDTTFYRFDKGSSGGTNVISDLASGSVGSTVVTSAINTAGSPDETRPINYAVHYCIKY